MSNQTNRILDEMFENEKLIEAHISHFKNFKKIFNKAKSFVSITLARIKIQQYNKMIKFLFF